MNKGDLSAAINRLLRADTNNFAKLLEASGINPSTDLTYANLSGVSFRDMDMAGFDLTGANLVDCCFDNAKIANANLDEAIYDVVALQRAADWQEYFRERQIDDAAPKLFGSQPIGQRSNLPTASKRGITQDKKSLILFVHGIGGSSSTSWGNFPALIRDDKELSTKYDVALDDYPTRNVRGVFARIGGLDLAAEGLRTRVAHRYSDYKDIAIIAHAQGGLIALRYMLDRLLLTEPMPLTRLLTYATPYTGATVGSLAVFLGVGSNQLTDLAPEGDFLFRLQRDWNLFRNQRRVSVKAVIADLDGVVGTGGAAALNIPHDLVSSSNHQTIVKPDSSAHASFLIAKRFLLTATAHQCVSKPLQHAIRLPEEMRTELQGAWHKLDERLRQNSNSWLEQWNGARSGFEAAYVQAVETGFTESWQAVIDEGRTLREAIRASVEDELDLPVHYLALTAYTDKIGQTLKVAATTHANAFRPEHEDLIARIEELEAKVGKARDVEPGSSGVADMADTRSNQMDELLRRLNKMESELALAKEKALAVAHVNDKNAFHAPIVLMHDAVKALKSGIYYLHHEQFALISRKAAKLMRLMGRRYFSALHSRFAALRVRRHRK